MTSAVPAPLSAPLDADAILCALVLVPSAYSRNQHPDLYDDPAMRRAHRRARVVRGLVRQMITHGSTPGEEPGPTGYVIHIEAPELGYRREARLSELEHDLVRYLFARARGESAPEPLARIERVLARLSS